MTKNRERTKGAITRSKVKELKKVVDELDEKTALLESRKKSILTLEDQINYLKVSQAKIIAELEMATQ